MVTRATTRRRAPRPTDRLFTRQRATALQRLLRRGLPEGKAEAWLEAWDVTTAGLVDFRRAPDFWQLGYEYAREEYRLGYEPPLVATTSQPRQPVPVRDELAPARIGAQP